MTLMEHERSSLVRLIQKFFKTSGSLKLNAIPTEQLHATRLGLWQMVFFKNTALIIMRHFPACAATKVRILLSIAACLGYHIIQVDVKTAFFYRTLEEDIYMEQPTGFFKDSSKVCKLVKSLCGLKQSPHC